MTDKLKPNAAEMLEEISHQVARHEAKEGKSTPEDRAWSRQLGETIEAQLAELRRNLTPADAPTEKAPPIPKSLFALTRDALVERIAELTRSMGGAVQYAHRNLKGLSDDDLRRLLATLDPTLRD